MKIHRRFKQQLLKNKKMGEYQEIFLHFTFLLFIYQNCLKVLYVQELKNIY